MYAKSGVDVKRGDKVVHLIKDNVKSTWDDRVKSDFGDFAGIYDFNNAYLVTSTDGVGTKTVATIATLPPEEAYFNLGIDIVNHCVNDILVKGGEPLFFLDYIASSLLNPENISRFVAGASQACRDNGCSLIGGETAEMPDVYNTGHVDIVGTIVGCVKPPRLIDGRSNITLGNVVIGLRSSGPHTNGYSLIRSLVKDLRPADVTPHRSYLPEIKQLWDRDVKINGLCHITGGGWKGNIKRVLPEGYAVNLRVPRPDVESIFTRVQEAGNVSDEEMLSVFNMGYGMLIFIDSSDLYTVMSMFKDATLLGTVHGGDDEIVLV